jgi:hypothetical protein
MGRAFGTGLWEELESLEKQSGKRPGCCIQSLMGVSGGFSEEQNANRNADSKDCSEGFKWKREFYWEAIHATFW